LDTITSDFNKLPIKFVRLSLK